MRFASAVVGVSLLITACTPTTTPTTATSETTTTTSPPEPGRLVVGFRDGHTSIVDEAGAVLVDVPLPSGAGQRFPVWLGDDAVVVAQGSAEGASLVAFSAADGSEVWKVDLDTPPFYYSPGPVGDPPPTTSLRNDPGGNGLIAELIDSNGEVSTLSRRSPFYTAWSPDGASLSIHEGQQTLGVRTDGTSVEIVGTTGTFQAPAWTSAGLFTLRTVAGAQRLSVWNGDTFTDVAEVPAVAQFVASGSKVALQLTGADSEGGVRTAFVAQQLPSIPNGSLVVLDVESGDVDIVIDVISPVFQWDPSGTRLLYATFGEEDPLDMSWHVWEAGTSTDLSDFLPQADWIRSLVPFFDQFMQSVSLWSPDGSHVAYPATVDGEAVVVVRGLDGTEFKIENAVWASWSG